jgi:hypothetical protein
MTLQGAFAPYSTVLPTRESNPQGKPTEERVKEGGGSEGSSVMEGIRIEIASDAKAG